MSAYLIVGFVAWTVLIGVLCYGFGYDRGASNMISWKTGTRRQKP